MNHLCVRSIGIGFLSLCVFMQVLGVPTSLWSMELAEDLVESSMLEALSLPSESTRFSVSIVSHSLFEIGRAVPGLLCERIPFRPPCLLH